MPDSWWWNLYSSSPWPAPRTADPRRPLRAVGRGGVGRFAGGESPVIELGEGCGVPACRRAWPPLLHAPGSRSRLAGARSEEECIDRWSEHAGRIEGERIAAPVDRTVAGRDFSRLAPAQPGRIIRGRPPRRRLSCALVQRPGLAGPGIGGARGSAGRPDPAPEDGLRRHPDRHAMDLVNRPFQACGRERKNRSCVRCGRWPGRVTCWHTERGPATLRPMRGWRARRLGWV